MTGSPNVSAHFPKGLFVVIIVDLFSYRLDISWKKRLKKGTNGIYWLMEQFYTYDDDYRLISSKPFIGLND